ncbi:hypothetical protein ATKI12_4548 [Kitasatospora sp. Ki12]
MDPGEEGAPTAAAVDRGGQRVTRGRHSSSKHLRCHEPPIPTKVKSVRRIAMWGA